MNKKDRENRDLLPSFPQFVALSVIVILMWMIIGVIQNNLEYSQKIYNMSADRSNQDMFCKALGYGGEYGVNNPHKFGCNGRVDLVDYSDLQEFCKIKDRLEIPCK